MSIVPRSAHEPITAEQLDALRERWPTPGRLVAAFALARDVETCAELLAGVPVAPERLDQEQLELARRRRLVRLDLTAIDLLEGAA